MILRFATRLSARECVPQHPRFAQASEATIGAEAHIHRINDQGPHGQGDRIIVIRGLKRSILISLAISAFPAFAFRSQTHPLFIILIGGVLFGSSFWSLGTFVLPRLKHRSFFLTVLLQAAAFYATILLCFLISMWLIIGVQAGGRFFDQRVLAVVREVVTDPSLIWLSLISFFIAVAISMFFQVTRKLGPGVLLNWATGKYHEPREETRIFMFLDMKDSTALAEQLGAIRFSSLIKDFLADLSAPVLVTRGEVSHYIGDEAVLTWTVERGRANANSLRFFSLMQAAIEGRRQHYLDRYGLVPEFKAGAHVGPVVATEVGEIKSEIVYHGDTLNTAARIQSLCGELDRPFLISRDLADLVGGSGSLEYVSMGLRELKGKAQPVEILAVQPKGAG